MVQVITWELAMVFSDRSSVSALVVTLALSFGTSGSAVAACYAPDQQLPAQTVNDFLSNSSQLLQDPKNAAGGADMIARVRDLVASNPASLPLVIVLLGNANPAQQTAIGTGLGQAAGLCIRPDPTFAADIQAQLAGSTSDTAKDAYAAVTGNRPIRSVAGGGGGGSSGASGGSTGSIGTTPSGSSSFTAFSANSVLSSPTSYFTGGSASAGSAGGNAASTSVSQ
jgi:hypothetical protein